MKFIVQNTTKLSPRLGTLSNFRDKPNLSLETPLVLLHTQGGQVPHMTHEVFKLLTKGPQILQIPLKNMHVYQEPMQQFSGTIADFIGNKEFATCISFQDPSVKVKEGHHVKNKVPLWAKNGLVYYDSTMYMKTIETFKPDMYFFLSDGDTNKNSPQKRILKSVDTSLNLFKECLEFHRNSNILQQALPIASISGGYCIQSRTKSMDVVLKNDEIGGFLIDGLHNNGPDVEFIKFEEVQTIVTHVIQNIPENKLISIQGCWNPETIIKFAQLGVDLFDSSYCRIVTDRSAALTFAIDFDEDLNDYEINLQNEKLVDDFQPILATCTCLTCKSYTKAYIHHLLIVQELLGPILIMIHNVHHYLRFFEKIRSCIKEKSLNILEQNVSKQFRHYEERRNKGQKEIAET